MPRGLTLRSRPLADAERALTDARTWREWREAAEAHDRLTGAWDWRADDVSPWYDAPLLRADVEALRAARDAGRGLALADTLTASVYRHQVDLASPELYQHALSGTKLLVGAWLDEVEASLRWLAAHPIDGLSPEAKRTRFEQAWRVYGHTALLLSGGATWGFHHLGVVKALFEHGVLPHILSGASTGAMVAAGVCTRDDRELAALFADPSSMRLDGLAPLGVRGAVRARAWLDPARLHEVLRHNVGDWTFAEAYARSGRVLSVSVSPARARQKPRLLSYVTAPDVLVASAALASSALPALFPPVVLEARGPDGAVVPYMPGDAWVDGTLYGDLPKLRLARLHNVNHFVVSQTNPHVAPILGLAGQGGLRSAMASAATVTARSQGAYAADVARRLTPEWAGPVRQLAERTHALVSQDYGGDIDIHPRFRLDLLGKVVTNLTPEDLAVFIREGERSTWPLLQRIADQTRLGRVFRECVGSLRPQTP